MSFWDKTRWWLNNATSHATKHFQHRIVAAIALWFRLHLPFSAALGSNPKHTIYTFFNLCYWNFNQKRTKKRRKNGPGLAHFKKSIFSIRWNLKIPRYCFWGILFWENARGVQVTIFVIFAKMAFSGSDWNRFSIRTKRRKDFKDKVNTFSRVWQ